MNKLKILLFVSLIVFSLSVTAKKVVDCAHKQIGIPYKSGGVSPKTGFDCSGLAYYCHDNNIPRSPQAQASKNKIKVKDKQPGDLLFFACSSRGKGPISHTVIYVGNEEFIEAPLPGMKVRKHKMNPYYCGGKIISASRYWK